MNLSEKHRKILVRILHSNFPDCRILLFGSRANGNPQKFSDIDVAIDQNGSSIPIMKLADAKQDLIESDLPYTVDIVDFNNIASAFKAKIELESIELKALETTTDI